MTAAAVCWTSWRRPGVDFDDVTDYLERDGLAKFEKSWSELGATVGAELERQQQHSGRS